MTRIYVTRHGNTFDKGDVITRVGGRTDLPLSTSGLAQAEALRDHFEQDGIKFDRAFCSPLKRTKKTAEIALASQSAEVELKVLPFLVEIDYGPDENKPEEEVVARIGEAALKAWEEDAIPPQGWHVEPTAVIGRWEEFFANANKKYKDETILLVTSNGIARFALSAVDGGKGDHALKLKTGAYGILDVADDGKVTVVSWNVRP
ncbi:histidine phosphatase family protein [Pseudovibrio sp. SPO723]|uniref:histidine phosphatase family protein n=1 Tax=Nesiotobacter zosterae TaxID=392721 RepID=UPI0029C39D89|nr:histidine phosphatase family protein [Pseudovibrio sp. SPO723]MDX5594062.1 histidine phosphatase family protein [Pseudovibrio sp. SPO723]